MPLLVPARMVNEAAYCPRLFYLEWVQSRFEDNADTVEGRWQHRVVDQPAGRVPAAGEGEVGEATSVLVSSDRLGLIGRIDLLDGDGTSVVPVDYKKGKPPDNPERSWEPERVQLCVLGLVLRDNGYTCDHGILWFAGSRERVEVPFTDELVDRTRSVVNDMREMATRDVPPAPLVHSAKCPRCSLVGVCLPDEHNALLLRDAKPPRRLTPSDSASRPLYVTEPGAVVGVRGGRIEVTHRERRLASVRPIDVSQICVFGNVQVTTQALRDCFATDVPVCYFSGGGWLSGIADGLPSKHVELRRRQAILASQGGLETATRIVRGKIRNCRTLLRRNGRPAPERTLDILFEARQRAGLLRWRASSAWRVPPPAVTSPPSQPC